MTLKPMRAGETITVPSATADTTIHDLKTEYASRTGLTLDRIKLLLNKKPAADLKTLQELGADGKNVELSVMVMGGGTGTPRAPSPVKMDMDPMPPAAAVLVSDPQTTGEETGRGQVSSPQRVLESEDFWNELGGFLTLQLKSEDEGKQLLGLFRSAWRDSR